MERKPDRTGDKNLECWVVVARTQGGLGRFLVRNVRLQHNEGAGPETCNEIVRSQNTLAFGLCRHQINVWSSPDVQIWLRFPQADLVEQCSRYFVGIQNIFRGQPGLFGRWHGGRIRRCFALGRSRRARVVFGLPAGDGVRLREIIHPILELCTMG